LNTEILVGAYSVDLNDCLYHRTVVADFTYRKEAMQR